MSSLTAESIYSDAATLGKTSSYIYLIVAIVIAVILVIYALHINSQPQKPSVKAFIITASCTTFNNGTGNRNNNISYSCLLNVKYKVNEIEYVNNLTTNSNLIYNPNIYIDIEYDPNNPNNINIIGMDNATQSKISVGIAVFIVAASGISYYLSQKSNVYAAGQGVNTVASIFRK